MTVPTLFVLGAASPIPPEHGIASAALIPGARYRVEDDCGHFIWLERPGSVRRALQDICGLGRYWRRRQFSVWLLILLTLC